MDDLLGVAACGKNSLDPNIYINSQIELKKLRFHTPDKNGKTKCHVMHVGRQNSSCKKVQVHGQDMQFVDTDTYLGDKINRFGKTDQILT